MPFQAPSDGDLPGVPEPGNKGSGRPGGGPPGGGPGSGPGQTAFAGGGIPPSVFRNLPGLGDDIPFILRRRGFQPGITPGPPGRSDTVPALLSPGEIVMNNGVTQDPQMAQQLLSMNQQGAMGFGQGGMVPGGGQFCPHCGMPHGQAQGYAQGGMVPGGFGQPSMPNFGGQPVQTRMFGQGLGGGFAGPGMSHAAPAPAQQGGYQYNPEGGVTGGYNPNDPWGTLTQNRDTRTYGTAARGLGGFGEAGYFDPRGNQMLLNSMREGAQGTADALVRRSVASADLGGLDPAQRAVAKLQAQREAGRGVQDIMANTRAQALGNQNDFAQSLYQQLLGGDLGFTGQTNQARLSDWLQGNQANREHKDQWGTLAGGVLGAGIGGFAGGYGQGMGQRAGKKP